MQQRKRLLLIGILLILLFIIWTILVKLIDVQPLGVNGTNIGFATINTWFHNLTGVHMKIYIITDCRIFWRATHHIVNGQKPKIPIIT